MFSRGLVHLLIAIWVGAGARGAGAPKAKAPYRTEAEAVAAGMKLGIGTAAIEGPASVGVYSHQTLTVVYTAGRAGIRQGGGIRIGIRHVHQWSPLQMTDPRAPGYVTVRAARNLPVEVGIDPKGQRFFSEHFPWQHMVEVILPDNGLEPGETIRVTYGDRSGGSPGIRVQPFDEARFVFKVYVDALGRGDYLPLEKSPAIEVVAASAFRLAVVMPSDAVSGHPTWCIVRAEDRYGNPAPSYRGAIAWQSGDPSAHLPAAYSFKPADRGVHRFEGLTLGSPGYQTVEVSDGTLQARGNPVCVAREQPAALLLWGDLHGHTLHSDGRGTTEEYYEFAQRFSGLDVCAVSDHAFQMPDGLWERSKAVTNRFYDPGRFVTFQAYEWSGHADVGGDHNVYFLDADPPLYRAPSYYDPRNLQMYHGPVEKVGHIEELFARLGKHLHDKNVLCIPHWGGRHGNPTWHHPGVQRLIEVFSEHRRSEDWAATFLEKYHRLGIMASGDNHYGNPGHGYLYPRLPWDRQEIGMAAVAIYAAERTREAVFRALYERCVYATSGARIILDVRADGHRMGSEYRATTSPTITIEAAGTAPISHLEIKRNGKTVLAVHPGTHTVGLKWRDPDFDAGRTHTYYVRVLQEDNEEAISSPIWVN